MGCRRVQVALAARPAAALVDGPNAFAGRKLF